LSPYCDQAKETAKEAKRMQIAEKKRLHTAAPKDVPSEKMQPGINTSYAGIAALSTPSDLPCNHVSEIDNSSSRTDLMVSTHNETLKEEVPQTAESPSTVLPSESKITCSNGTLGVASAAAARNSGESDESHSIADVRSNVKISDDVKNLCESAIDVVVDDPLNKNSIDDNPIIPGFEKVLEDNQAKWLAVVLSSVQKVSHSDLRVGP
jgi:hypothetical protein